MLNEAHTKDRRGNMVLRVLISRMRHDGCGGLPGRAELLTGIDGVSSQPVRRIDPRAAAFGAPPALTGERHVAAAASGQAPAAALRTGWQMRRQKSQLLRSVKRSLIASWPCPTPARLRAAATATATNIAPAAIRNTNIDLLPSPC
jgi:hypothetical protein